MDTLKKVLVTVVFSARLHAGWDFPDEAILLSGRTSNTLEVGIDASGNAIAAWINTDNSKFLVSNWNGSAWLPLAHTELGSNATLSDLAVSANGTALAAWRDLSGINASFWDGSTWQSAEMISIASSAGGQRVVMNSDGIGFALWIDTSSTLPTTNRWNGSQWLTTPQTINLPTTSSLQSNDFEVDINEKAGAVNPGIGVDGNGNAVAIYRHSGFQRIYASSWRNGDWLDSQYLSPNTQMSQLIPDNKGLGVDDSGNAVAMWYNATVDELQASVYNFDNDEWTPTDSIASAITSPNTMLAVGSGGQAIVIYIDAAGGLYSKTLNGLTWSDPVLIKSSITLSMDMAVNLSFATSLNLVVDASGNAIATWSDNLENSILASTWDGSVWSDPETLSELVGTEVLLGNQDSAINASGEAVVVWGVQAGTGFKSNAAATDDFIGTLFGSGFFQPISPSDFSGRVGKNKFSTQTDHINFLTWAPSADTSVVGYRVYQGESVVAEVSSEGPFEAAIHNRIKNFPYMYRLVAFNAADQESDPVILNVN